MRCPRRDEQAAANMAEHFFPRDDQWRTDDTCSYCGSLNPDVFLQRVKDGSVELGATDKNYKVYVKAHGFFSKFYFQHLSIAQRNDFIKMYNMQMVKFEHNDHFYVLPFFMRPMPLRN